jgi:polynucleotide 5'-kinase involved in rRNA processing
MLGNNKRNVNEVADETRRIITYRSSHYYPVKNTITLLSVFSEHYKLFCIGVLKMISYSNRSMYFKTGLIKI